MAESSPDSRGKPRESEALRPRGSDRDLAATLHEVGNGLTVVLGWLEAARAAAADGVAVASGATASHEAALRQALAAIEVASARARRAHGIARRAIGAGHDAAPDVERAADVVDEAVQGLLHEGRAAGVRFDVKLAEAATSASIDAGGRLLQVLTNLLLNAVSVTPRGGAAAITGNVQSGKLEITVVDAGPGIPEAERDRIFRRGATSREDGAGIGLAHAHAVVTEEGGSLTLAPFTEGSGARFDLCWPLASADRAVPSSRPIDSSPLTARLPAFTGYRVAVLDDDLALVELLETVLVARGASVRATRDLPALERVLQSEPIDVALVDASPLGSDVEGTLRRLQAAHPGTFLVLISGADPGDVVSGLGVTWIRKPFEIHEVADVLRVLKKSP